MVYFRKKIPVIYDGDLVDSEKFLRWLVSPEMFQVTGEIEEVNRKMLEKLLEDNDFLLVFFDSGTCLGCGIIDKNLKIIRHEADTLGVNFVKIVDKRYAKKYGVGQLPCLVYFRRKFPTIFRGNLSSTDSILQWLIQNRFKHMELNLITYGTLAIALSFLTYTTFLKFSLIRNSLITKPEDEQLEEKDK